MTENSFADNLEAQAQEQTWRHIDLVMRLLASGQIELMRRQFTHDRTKLISPEREMFAKATHRLRGLTYGSPEYKECLKEMMGEALGHHYFHNRHHPEFFEEKKDNEQINQLLSESQKIEDWLLSSSGDTPDIKPIIEYLQKIKLEHQSSVNNMNLFDILEMLIDWTAATKRHADGNIHKSIEINRVRFGLSDQLVEILKNTVPWIEDEFERLNTQRDIGYERGLKQTHIDGASLDNLK